MLGDELKTEIFDDLASIPDFAAAIDRSERTVRRLNLPVRYIGRTPYIIVSKARAKIMGETGEPARGRPRHAA